MPIRHYSSPSPDVVTVIFASAILDNTTERPLAPQHDAWMGKLSETIRRLSVLRPRARLCHHFRHV